jgi:hypothetical protein
MFFSVVSVVSVVSVLLLATFFPARKEEQILRCHESARSALECGSASYRLVFVECKAAVPLRFAAALQGASRIFMDGGEPKDHEVCAQDDMSFSG